MLIDRRRAERERRRAPRVRATFAVKSLVGGAVALAQCEDLGPTGMTLRRVGGSPLPAGTPVKLAFALPDERTLLTVQASVVSDRGAGYFRRTGLRFERLSAEALRRVRAFCARPARAESVAHALL